MNSVAIDTDRSRSFRFLKMQMSLALPLLKAEPSPFRDYRCETEAWIEGGLFGEGLTIFISDIPDPTQTKPLQLSASFEVIRDRVVVQCRGQTCAVLPLADLTAHQIAEAFCDANQHELVRAFTKICDFAEAKMDDGLPF